MPADYGCPLPELPWECVEDADGAGYQIPLTKIKWRAKKVNFYLSC